MIIDLSVLIGKTQAEAEQMIQANPKVSAHRAVSIEGVAQSGLLDQNPTRVNLKIKGGVVSAASLG